MGSGQFHCPHCDVRRAYDHRKSQQWFTLYFIPVFPIKTYGEYVTCEGCANTFDPAVLSYDPTQARAARDAQIAGLWRAALMSVASAFGPPTPERAAAARAGLLSPEEADGFEQDLRATPANGVERAEIVSRFSALAEPLTTEGKEKLFRAAVDAARAGEPQGEDSDEMLAEIGAALGLSAAHARGVMSA
jgi:hypothetical protein